MLDAYPLPRLDKMVESISHYSVFSTLDLQSAYHQIPLKVNEKEYTAFEAAGNLFQFTRVPFGVTNGVSAFQRTIDKVIKSEGLDGTFAYIDNVTICGTDESSHDVNLKKFLETAQKYGLTFNDSKSVLRQTEIDLLGYRISKGKISPNPVRFQALHDLPQPTSLKGQKRIVGIFSYYSQWIKQLFSDKIQPLNQNTSFPLPYDVLQSFKLLKDELKNAVLTTVDHNRPLVVETDASDIAISATLNQDGRPVAFFSRTLNHFEKNHASVEKEAYAIVESIRKWKHYLIASHFKLVTDQKSVSFIFDKHHKSKVKNEKILRWKIELSPFSYDVVYRPGVENLAPDAFSRCNALRLAPDAQTRCNALQNEKSLADLQQLHETLRHPGISRMTHFVRSKNLPYSVEEIKTVSARCRACAELKPRFYKPSRSTVIKATQPFERLSVDFKGPLPSTSRNKYLLTIIDEYSRFPFAFPCSDTSAETVKKCFIQLFSIFGMPCFVHSDRGTGFMSQELQTFLYTKGIATSRTTPYNPRGNGQVEKLNGTLWKAIQLSLKSQNLPASMWETVLCDALHSIRSLLCTETNVTPHERMFQHDRRSTNGSSLPSWLVKPGPILIKRNVRSSKYEPLVDEVELLSANPQYAHVRFPDGKESTVSLRQLAPTGGNPNDDPQTIPPIMPVEESVELAELQESTSEASTNISPVLYVDESPTVPDARAPPFVRTTPYNLRSGPK